MKHGATRFLALQIFTDLPDHTRELCGDDVNKTSEETRWASAG